MRGSSSTATWPGEHAAASQPTDLETLWSYLTVGADEHPSDVLFCFGSYYFGVARRAARLYEMGVAPWILVTGGTVGRINPFATEADAYADLLRECGVPAERIVIDHLASNTGENVHFGMRALAERGVTPSSAALVAWPTSLRRCVATFTRQFPDVITYTQPAFEGFGPYELTLARAVETSLAELARLRTYPSLGYITEQPIPDAVDLAAERLAGFKRLEFPRVTEWSEQLAG